MKIDANAMKVTFTKEEQKMIYELRHFLFYNNYHDEDVDDFMFAVEDEADHFEEITIEYED